MAAVKKYYYKYGHGIDDVTVYGPFTSVAAAQKGAMTNANNNDNEDFEYEIVMIVSRTARPETKWEEVE